MHFHLHFGAGAGYTFSKSQCPSVKVSAHVYVCGLVHVSALVHVLGLVRVLVLVHVQYKGTMESTFEKRRLQRGRAIAAAGTFER